jgi:uncharacterized protein YndB with AHSA1/START domain/uncharacterized protein YciI
MTDASRTTVHRSITVPLAQGAAFALFTDGMDSWWPRDGYSIGQAPSQQSCLEAYEGGRWFERSTDGSEHVWGRVLHWQPPHRVVMSWQISPDWTADLTVATEVDIRFTDIGAGGTRVDLEHRHLDRYGDRQGDMLVALGSPDGWQAVLAAYAAKVAPIGFDRHTLVTLILRPAAPELSPAEAEALQNAHLAHTADLVAAGHILAAGPPVDPDDERLRGISLWSVDPNTARRMCDEDPAVRAGRLAAQVATWMTPSGQLRFERVRVPRSMAEVEG